MHTITKQLRTETGHRLINYNGRCAHLHGHSYLWEVTVTSEKLDDRNMIADFKELKEAMSTILDPLDHCLVLSPEDNLLHTPHYEPEELFKATNGESPRLTVWHENPTAESFAEWAFRKIGELLPANVKITRVKVWETATSFAEYTNAG